MEAGDPHHLPHFHACHQEAVALFSLERIELIVGSLPWRQRRLVEAWAEPHHAKLMTDWRRLESAQAPLPLKRGDGT